MEDNFKVLQDALTAGAPSFPPQDEIYKLGLWLFLQKLGIMGISKHTISHMMTMVINTNSPLKPVIPKGAITLPILGLSIEYLVPCDRKDSNWPPTNI